MGEPSLRVGSQVGLSYLWVTFMIQNLILHTTRLCYYKERNKFIG